MFLGNFLTMVKGHRKTCPNCDRDGWMQLDKNGQWKFLDFPDSASLRWQAHDCNRRNTGQPYPGKRTTPSRIHGGVGPRIQGGVDPAERIGIPKFPPNKHKESLELPKDWFGFMVKLEEKSEFDEEFSDMWS